MSKVIWILSVLILALFENVQPLVLTESPLIINGYYTSTLGEDDPAAIYQSFYSNMDRVPCATAPRKATDYEMGERTEVTYPNGGLYAYVLMTTGSDYSGTVGSDELVPIVAPFPCQILTDPNNSDYSRTMVVRSTLNPSYKMQITGMERWYCCVTHDKGPSGVYQHAYVDKSSYGRTIDTGYTLGMANDQTSITFLKDDVAIPFTEFYGEGFPEDCKIDVFVSSDES